MTNRLQSTRVTSAGVTEPVAETWTVQSSTSARKEMGTTAIPSVPPGGGAGRLPLGEHLAELIDRPVQFLAGDDEGWCETNGVGVSVLTEESAVLEGVAVLSRTTGAAWIELYARPRVRDGPDLPDLRRPDSPKRFARCAPSSAVRSMSFSSTKTSIAAPSRLRMPAGCHRRSIHECLA